MLEHLRLQVSFKKGEKSSDSVLKADLERRDRRQKAPRADELQFSRDMRVLQLLSCKQLMIRT